ncbi:hypothetical protein XENOCAPTIV_026774 [Xenoophorus captivus]|uniref:Uncharacterized protein n=1 Tax=Xenoophorus captivus TaxID=1517983 RepID=A0ABV0SH65_9TELE
MCKEKEKQNIYISAFIFNFVRIGPPYPGAPLQKCFQKRFKGEQSVRSVDLALILYKIFHIGSTSLPGLKGSRYYSRTFRCPEEARQRLIKNDLVEKGLLNIR